MIRFTPCTSAIQTCRLRKYVRGVYYASKPLETARIGAQKQSFLTKTKKFFNALYNTNFVKPIKNMLLR